MTSVSSDIERACPRASGGAAEGEAGVAAIGGCMAAAADAGDASDAEYGVARVSGETADVSGGAIEDDGGTAKLE